MVNAFDKKRSIMTIKLNVLLHVIEPILKQSFCYQMDTFLDNHFNNNISCCCCLPSETYGRNVVTQIVRSLQNCQLHHRRLESLALNG